MLTGLVRNVISFGASSNFEKARLQATYNGDTESPKEQDLQVVLDTLQGKDQTVRPQIAFTTILQKLESSQSKFKWNYLIKNLIILDRCVDERFFVQDIANLKIGHVETYTESDPQYQYLSLDQLIRLYFRYIKFKAFVYSKKNTSFNMNSKEVKQYFSTQTNLQIYDEFSMSQKLHEIIMEVAATDKRGHLRFKVNQYVFLMLLYTLTNLFSTQFMATLALVEKLFSMNKEEASTFKTLYTKYLKQIEELVIFVNTHKYIKGYGDINANDFAKCDTRISVAIDQYITHLQSSVEEQGLPEEIILDDDQQLVLETAEKNIRKSVIDFNEPPPPLNRITRPNVMTFEDWVQQKCNSPNLQGAEYSQFENALWDSFANNFSTSYTKIDSQFFKQRESAQREGLRFKLGQEEDSDRNSDSWFNRSSSPEKSAKGIQPIKRQESESPQKSQINTQSLPIRSTSLMPTTSTEISDPAIKMTHSETIHTTVQKGHNQNNPNGLTESDFDVQLLDEDAFPDIDDM